MNRKPSVRILITRGITTLGDAIKLNADAMNIATPAIDVRINPASKNSMSVRDVVTCALRTTPITSRLAPIKANPKRKYKIKK
jgi:hypothetical protein